MFQHAIENAHLTLCMLESRFLTPKSAIKSIIFNTDQIINALGRSLAMLETRLLISDWSNRTLKPYVAQLWLILLRYCCCVQPQPLNHRHSGKCHDLAHSFLVCSSKSKVTTTNDNIKTGVNDWVVRKCGWIIIEPKDVDSAIYL